MIGVLAKLVIGLLIGGAIGAIFGFAFNDYNIADNHEDSEQSIVNKSTGGISDEDDDFLDDFIMPRDAMSIARGENPLDPEAQWESITDPLDLFGYD